MFTCFMLEKFKVSNILENNAANIVLINKPYVKPSQQNP